MSAVIVNQWKVLIFYAQKLKTRIQYIRQNSRTSSRFVLRLKWVFRVKLIIHYYIFCWSYGYIINVCPITSSLYYFRDFPTFRFIYLTFCLLFLPLWAELLLFRREDSQQTEMNKTFWNPKSFVSFFSISILPT